MHSSHENQIPMKPLAILPSYYTVTSPTPHTFCFFSQCSPIFKAHYLSNSAPQLCLIPGTRKADKLSSGGCRSSQAALLLTEANCSVSTRKSPHTSTWERSLIRSTSISSHTPWVFLIVHLGWFVC